MTTSREAELNAEAELSRRLTDWDEAAKKADYWTTREKELRSAIFGDMFKTPKPGMNKIHIPHGMALVGDYRLNYRIDKPLMEELMKEPVTAAIIADIVSFRPEVNGSKFRKLDVDAKNLVAPMITETPGTPGLEIKPANKVRW